MPQTSSRTPPLMTPPSEMPVAENFEPTAISSRKVRRVPRVTVEFGCLMCAREFGVLVCAALPVAGVVRIEQPGGFHLELPVDRLRFLRCATCGGSVLPSEVTREEVRVERPINWAEDRPRRGRPPKSLVEQRRREAQGNAIQPDCEFCHNACRCGPARLLV